MTDRKGEINNPIYPCVITIKIIGDNHLILEKGVAAVFSRRKSEIIAGSIKKSRSKEERYLSITVRIAIKDRRHLEEVNEELMALEKVLLVL